MPGLNPETKPLGAQLSHMLRARGVDTIFGIPGVHNQELYRGIEEAGITHILARHEQGAGFMADGYARATGRPGVCYVITGPGLCNVLTPLGQAYSDSVPVLCISSCLDDTAGRRGQLHQMLDQRGAAATVCDWSEEARTEQAAYALIDRAFVEFDNDRPRPKHIQVPISVLEAPAAAPRAGWWTEDGPRIFRGHPRNDYLKTIAARLLNAERPVIILGGGVAGSDRQGSIARLVEGVKAATFVTYAGRGAVAPDCPFFLGATLARPDSAEVLRGSDCVLVLGSDLAEVDLWREDPGIATGAGIYVNLDPEVLACAGTEDMAIQFDAFEAVCLLVRRIAELDEAPASRWSAAEIGALRAQWRRQVMAERPGLVPVIDALREAMPDDAMIYSDMTQFAYAAKEVWDMPKPRHWHHPTGFGTLGYALPAAIGGAVARLGKPTVAIAGDYGFQFTLQELGTAVELGLPLPIIVWDNGKLGEIEDSMVSAQIPPHAVQGHNPDFPALARAYGAHATAPTSHEEVGAALTEALAADRPTVIHLRAGLS
ncbi:MAG: thiamine pyrophosphate-binding protein [Shimia sp.]